MKQGTNLHVYTWSRTVRLGGFAPARENGALSRLYPGFIVQAKDVTVAGGIQHAASDGSKTLEL